MVWSGPKSSLPWIASSSDSRVRALALVSPSSDYRGVRMDSALRQYGSRPALFISSLHDPYAARSVRTLAQDTSGPREVRWSSIAAHGTLLLSLDQDLVAGVGNGFSWIGGNDIAVEGTYVWVNGEPWDGAPWGGDFSKEAPIHDCVEIFTDSGFTAYECTYPKPPLCEASPVEANPPKDGD